MRSCRKCFEYAYVFVGGDVRMCPWNGIVIGNLCENTLEEIWRSPRAEEVRQAFLRGELLGCSERYCPDCIQNSTTLEIEPEELQRMYEEMPDLPIQLSLAYDERCNHACPSCRHGFFVPDKEYRDKLDIITKNIEPYLSNVKGIATNGIGDLFVSTEIVDMLSRLEPKNPEFSIFIETNGVLFKKNWDKIKNLAGKNITVSVTPNSFDRETYRYLAGKDDLAKFEESMEFITELKHQGAISRIRMIMVIQDSNFRQIPEFIRRCIDYDADDIVLRPIFQWFGMNEDEVLYKNVLNPCHPYYQEYLEIIEHPLCRDPRVFNWGFEEKQEAVSFPTLAMKRRLKGEKKFEKYLDEALSDLENELDECKGKKIYLFGAGKIGKMLLEKLTSGERAVPIAGFAVSCADDAQCYYRGYPIMQFDKIEDRKESVFVLATTNPDYEQDMAETIKNDCGAKYITINDKGGYIC